MIKQIFPLYCKNISQFLTSREPWRWSAQRWRAGRGAWPGCERGTERQRPQLGTDLRPRRCEREPQMSAGWEGGQCVFRSVNLQTFWLVTSWNPIKEKEKSVAVSVKLLFKLSCPIKSLRSTVKPQQRWITCLPFIIVPLLGICLTFLICHRSCLQPWRTSINTDRI